MTISMETKIHQATGFKANFYKCGRYVQVFINCTTGTGGTIAADGIAFDIPTGYEPLCWPLVVTDIQAQPSYNHCGYYIRYDNNKFSLHVGGQGIAKSHWYIGCNLFYIAQG